MTTQPQIFVLGGPNGAGKSSVASVMVPDSLGVDEFVNADLISKGISPFSPEGAAIAAGRVMITRIRELRARRETFALESTLAARSLARFLREAQDAGYLVHVIYIWLKSVDLAQSRVRGRVAAGGHHIPPDVIERRYWRGLRNFFGTYQPLADSWTIWDNSEEEVSLVAEASVGSSPIIRDAARMGTIQDQLINAPQ